MDCFGRAPAGVAARRENNNNTEELSGRSIREVNPLRLEPNIFCTISMCELEPSPRRAADTQESLSQKYWKGSCRVQHHPVPNS